MEKRDEDVVTHIKYEKTSCYFCNEWLDSENFPVSLFSDHLIFSLLKSFFFHLRKIRNVLVRTDSIEIDVLSHNFGFNVLIPPANDKTKITVSWLEKLTFLSKTNEC